MASSKWTPLPPLILFLCLFLVSLFPTTNAQALGATCPTNSNCFGSNVYISTQCSPQDSVEPNKCGGAGAYCVANDGGSSGTSDVCSSGFCTESTCQATTTTANGAVCNFNYECGTNVRCVADQDGTNRCIGGGTSCSADNGASTGDSAQCPSGFCRSGGCSDVPAVNVGGTCYTSNQCKGGNGYANIPATCSPQDSICGGSGEFSYSDDGGSFGPSSNCASGKTKDYYCTSATTLQAGEECVGSYMCELDLGCVDNGSGTARCASTGRSCTADDGSYTGSTTFCASGFCRGGSCSDVPSVPVGGRCTASSSCVGEGYSETTPSCSSIDSLCGGEGEFAYSNDGSSTGSSSICASGLTKDYVCTPINPRQIGDECTANYQCLGDVTCNNGICAGGGAACAADDGTPSGPTAQCTSGYCRQGSCSDSPAVPVGGTCTTSNSCAGEGYMETVPSCSSIDSLCGGEAEFAYSNDGSGTGPSSNCASGFTKDYVCTPIVPRNVGDACTASYQCLSEVSCIDGTCSGGGYKSCTADDGTSSGPTMACTSGYCRMGSCSNPPARAVGATCKRTEECVGEGYNELNPSCSEETGTCGGFASFSYADDGSGTGPSSICASGQTKDYLCTPLNPKQPGEACSTSSECIAEVTCVNGFCTGGGAFCTATDGSGDNTGPSTMCTSGFCRYSRCSNPPATPLGGQCTTGDDCEGMGHSGTARIAVECGSNRCGGEGAACFADQGGPRGASVMCSSGLCVGFACTAPSVSPVPRKRDGVVLEASPAVPHLACPVGLIPCPVYPKGFECVDVNDVETCGGCVGEHLPGRDCTAIVGVDSVECREGGCKINECEYGFEYVASNRTCVAFPE